MLRVFISHSYDDHEYAERLRGALEKLDIGSAFDPVETTSGETVSKTIRKRIEAADAVVILLSKRALESGWVMFELGIAEALGKKVVSVVLPGIDVDKLDYIERDRAVMSGRTLSPLKTARRISELVAKESI